MEELIKKLEALKWGNETASYSANDVNTTLYEAIAILQSQTVIKAKALRKKGTDEFYIYDALINEWCTCQLPELLAETAAMKAYEYLSEKGLAAADLPYDAELIDIEIIVKG
ncbi:MAG: hypothetical protein WC222_11595 [Parachlamydiales bacterium]|jgi:hypothetical protein